MLNKSSLVLFFLTLSLFAQSYPSLKGFSLQENEAKSKAKKITAGGYTNTKPVSSPTSPMKNIDFYVDESNYFLGTGDQITAFIWGAQEEQITIYVTGDGTLIVPTVGAYKLSHTPLNEVKDTLKKEIGKKYRAKSIDLFLSRVKSVEVAVYGEIKNPGIYRVSGAATIASVINEAGGFSEDANKRAVEVSNHQSPTTDMVDVQALFRVAQATPVYVKSGDKIFVKPRERVVSISGAVLYPDMFDYVVGDPLSKVVSLSGGLSADADTGRIIVTRFVDDYDSLEKITVSMAQADSFILEPEDRILVSKQKEFRESRQVTVVGEVEYPGVYAIREDKTLLVDIIEIAGGLTDQAFPEGSWITREDFNDAGAQEYFRLMNLPYMELSPEERLYLKYRTSSDEVFRSTVSLDFSELLRDGTKLEDIVLRSGDIITIAKKDLSVNVMGAVVRPGLVAYKEGASFDYYIDQTGGYKSDAKKRRARVIKAGTEIWLKPRQADNIVAGDAIWVPEKEYVDGVKRTNTILGFISAVTGIVASTILIIDYLD